ncbi:MAG: hypothetical protein OXO56_08040 [Gammaproteobacteria bacterium]|nr:hypothetical protein [Gammaproteobacteria bacterium]
MRARPVGYAAKHAQELHVVVPGRTRNWILPVFAALHSGRRELRFFLLPGVLRPDRSELAHV